MLENKKGCKMQDKRDRSKEVYIQVSEDTKKKAKIMSATKGVPMKEYIEELVSKDMSK
jgi:predicted DNA binding CopG/RHH family protein